MRPADEKDGAEHDCSFLKITSTTAVNRQECAVVHSSTIYWNFHLCISVLFSVLHFIGPFAVINTVHIC